LATRPAPSCALLIECGQHWERAAEDVAIDTLVRFLGLTGLVDAAWVAAQTRLPLPPVQRLVRVTEAVVARSADFHFLLPTEGLGVIPKAGTPLARDGEHVWHTPYDNTVLVMPGTKNLKPGGTAVRWAGSSLWPDPQPARRFRVATPTAARPSSSIALRLASGTASAP
jgi:hypothetical protein